MSSASSPAARDAGDAPDSVAALEWHEASLLEMGKTYFYYKAVAATAPHMRGHFVIGKALLGGPWRLRWFGRRRMPRLRGWTGPGTTSGKDLASVKQAAQAMYERALASYRKRLLLLRDERSQRHRGSPAIAAGDARRSRPRAA